MILGVIIGTYSSIFIANPVLVFLRVSQKTILKEEQGTADNIKSDLTRTHVVDSLSKVVQRLKFYKTF